MPLDFPHDEYVMDVEHFGKQMEIHVSPWGEYMVVSKEGFEDMNGEILHDVAFCGKGRLKDLWYRLQVNRVGFQLDTLENIREICEDAYKDYMECAS